MTHGSTPAAPGRAAQPLDAPRRPGERARLDNLDLTRGIAVMGIVFANIAGMGQPLMAAGWPGAFRTPPGPAADWLWLAQYVLVDGKMRGVFSLLFGAGVYLFMERAWARGHGAALQARRLGWLLVFGLIHFFVLWRGDILTTYALAGLALLPFLRLDPRGQLVLGGIVYGLGQVIYVATSVPAWLAAQGGGERARAAAGGVRATLAEGALEGRLIESGRFTAWIAHNWAAHAAQPFTQILYIGFETIPFMLIGMALYRLGLFTGGFDRRAQARWGAAALVGGAALFLLAGLWTVHEGLSLWGVRIALFALAPVPRMMMALGLLALLALTGAGSAGWLGDRVRAAGRTAFSNYLGTSLVLLPVFHGWGLGLFGRLTRLELYGVAALVCVGMLVWSAPWLVRHRYGPLEWLWRCLAYGRRFPLGR